jgi:hypothetical protein
MKKKRKGPPEIVGLMSVTMANEAARVLSPKD